MKVGAIILSRFSSSRLPGKALMTINGKSILQYIVERTAQVFDKKDIVLATSLDPSDDAIEAFAISAGIQCYRGSLANVAERFYNAGSGRGWDYAVRINGDNIFVDIPLLQEMKNIAETGQYDFVSNVKGRTYPKGMSIEILRLDHYNEVLEAIKNSKDYQEHVTLYMYDNDADCNYHYVKNLSLPEAAGIQLALDTKDDFEMATNIISHFQKSHTEYNLEEVFNLYQSNHK
jgi:spore coat polysaccharide biosynthesis protein SpsF